MVMNSDNDQTTAQWTVKEHRRHKRRSKAKRVGTPDGGHLTEEVHNECFLRHRHCGIGRRKESRRLRGQKLQQYVGSDSNDDDDNDGNSGTPGRDVPDISIDLCLDSVEQIRGTTDDHVENQHLCHTDSRTPSSAATPSCSWPTNGFVLLDDLNTSMQPDDPDHGKSKEKSIRSKRSRQKPRVKKSRQKTGVKGSQTPANGVSDLSARDFSSVTVMDDAEMCAVCYDLMVEPHTLVTCGHTFCRNCLCQLAQHSPAACHCPKCRAVITRCVHDTDIEQRLKEAHPDYYRQRLQQVRRLHRQSDHLPHLVVPHHIRSNRHIFYEAMDRLKLKVLSVLKFFIFVLICTYRIAKRYWAQLLLLSLFAYCVWKVMFLLATTFVSLLAQILYYTDCRLRTFFQVFLVVISLCLAVVNYRQSLQRIYM